MKGMVSFPESKAFQGISLGIALWVGKPSPLWKAQAGPGWSGHLKNPWCRVSCSSSDLKLLRKALRERLGTEPHLPWPLPAAPGPDPQACRPLPLSFGAFPAFFQLQGPF